MICSIEMRSWYQFRCTKDEVCQESLKSPKDLTYNFLVFISCPNIKTEYNTEQPAELSSMSVRWVICRCSHQLEETTMGVRGSYTCHYQSQHYPVICHALPQQLALVGLNRQRRLIPSHGKQRFPFLFLTTRKGYWSRFMMGQIYYPLDSL